MGEEYLEGWWFILVRGQGKVSIRYGMGEACQARRWVGLGCWWFGMDSVQIVWKPGRSAQKQASAKYVEIDWRPSLYWLSGLALGIGNAKCRWE